MVATLVVAVVVADVAAEIVVAVLALMVVVAMKMMVVVSHLNIPNVLVLEGRYHYYQVLVPLRQRGQ